MTLERTRNFCIIAHVDHGKSTLADRLLELTRTVSERDRRDQLLDQMDLERERGITIKLQAVRMQYERGGQQYLLNLIDTPGHVDFSYEVSRSLAACEGALLVVDAAQGIEAQTVANLYLAREHDLTIIPVINKIDLPSARPEEIAVELIDYGFDPDDVLYVSAKEGTHVDKVLDAVVDRLPTPAADVDAPLKALIFDSHYDPYQGIVAYVRVMAGAVAPGDRIHLMASDSDFEVDDVGIFTPDPERQERLAAGEVGFLTAGIKDIQQARVGDTITHADEPAVEPLPGYRRIRPMVFCGLYPTDTDQQADLREALERLQLNDAAFDFEPESSAALGFGFRCGFLGLLHMEIVQERLEREFDLDLVTTAPSAVYRIHTADGETLTIDNPAHMPERGEVEAIEEPVVAATIMTPEDHVGGVMDLLEDYRGEHGSMTYRSDGRVLVEYRLPLGEIMYEFFDQLKSKTRGYATVDYRPDGYQEADLVRVDILVNREPVDALSFITHRDRAGTRGRAVIKRLKELIPRQMFEVPLQASIGSRVVAREDIPAQRKNVLSKCYGGDVTRKRKLLERQKEGKRRMKQVGSVDIPQEAFMAVLSLGDDDDAG